MIRIAIVEDEEDYVNQLTKYLQDYQKNSNEEIDVTVYRDGDEITSKYKSQYDIILMDIQMKFVDGMTAAEEIRNIDSKVIIIFITKPIIFRWFFWYCNNNILFIKHISWYNGTCFKYTIIYNSIF